MTLKFTGTYDELKGALDLVCRIDGWIDRQDNQKQYKHPDGATINWYPSTGTILIQAVPEVKQSLEILVSRALEEYLEKQIGTYTSP